ncbi:MAG: M23 family metallopeptidase [Candidatus Gracilibacteria bacterium]|jgi:hypothetical protein
MEIILKRPIFQSPYFKYERMGDGTGVISQFFGENATAFYAQLGLKGHNGIDFPCFEGMMIFAAHDGYVVKTYDEFNSSPTKGYGVYIQDNEGTYQTVYWHLSKVDVKVGDIIKAGDLIGKSGNTGQYTTGPHLHFGLYLLPITENGYGGAVDPMPYFEEFIIKIDDMKLVIDGNQNQWLLHETYKVAYSISDELTLSWYKNHGLVGEPVLYDLVGYKKMTVLSPDDVTTLKGILNI